MVKQQGHGQLCAPSTDEAKSMDTFSLVTTSRTKRIDTHFWHRPPEGLWVSCPAVACSLLLRILIPILGCCAHFVCRSQLALAAERVVQIPGAICVLQSEDALVHGLAELVRGLPVNHITQCTQEIEIGSATSRSACRMTNRLSFGSALTRAN
eukprot:1156398-Pelagomonas_calceolata.AAC.6